VSTKEPEAEGEAGKKGGKKKLIIIGALVLALGGGGAAVWLMMGKKHEAAAKAAVEEEDDEEEESPHPPAHAAASGSDETGKAQGASKAAPAARDRNKGRKVLEYLSGDPNYTVNLADDDADRYLQLGLVFEITDVQAGLELKERMPALRSDILLLLSAKKSRELNTREAKDQLAEELLALTRRVLPARQRKGVKAIDFSMFVIQ
jgi:flagellar FliL protein